MLDRTHILLATALCVSSYAMAASPSIGTVTTRAETRIDNYEVKGSGTLFDGSVIETGGSHADLRLANNGGMVTLYANSRGTVHTDHFLLEHGSIGLTSKSFNVQADNLVFVPAGDSSGLVTVEDGKSVVVLAEKGTLEVRNAAGARIAQVRPGSPLSFTWTAATGADLSRNNQHDPPTVDAKMIPSVLMLRGVSTQTSSQLASISPHGASSRVGCPSGEVAGLDGGCCYPSQLENCCPHSFINECCGSLTYNSKQCGASK